MEDLTAAEPGHIAGELVHGLAAGGLTVTVLHRGDVRVRSWALCPGRRQSVVLTVHRQGDVCRSAGHWQEETKICGLKSLLH